MNQNTAIGVEWTISGGAPSVSLQIRLDAPGVTVSNVPGVGSLVSLNLEVQAAHILGRVLIEKAEAAASRAGVALQGKSESDKT
jgi:hypothetical protein